MHSRRAIDDKGEFLRHGRLKMQTNPPEVDLRRIILFSTLALRLHHALHGFGVVRENKKTKRVETMPRIDRDGVGIYYEIHGEGPPLLLVNGYASTGEDWDPTFLAALAERFEVIAPDNPGLGGSEALPGTLSVEAMAAAHDRYFEYVL